mgnify:CR=1 FL=1
MKGKKKCAKICPLCNQRYSDYPAISRSDNKTQICPDCGIREVLSGLGITRNEQNEIIDSIRRCKEKGK